MQRKYSIGIALIVSYAILIFTVPSLVLQKNVAPILIAITLIMVAVYVLLGLGIMIIVAILGETGVFYQVGIKIGKISKGNVWILMMLLCIFTSVASMFVDNVTTIML